MRDLILKIMGKIGYYPKRIKFRESTRYAKEIFKDKPITVTEIGVDEGKNTLNILQNLNVKKIYLIDPYSDYEDYGAKTNYINKAKTDAIKRLKKYKDKIVWIYDFSDKAINKIPECDFIYVDGNHHYDFIKEDLKLYFPKVKRGGIFAGHDIEQKGVFRAISRFIVRNKLNGWVGYPDWIIRVR